MEVAAGHYKNLIFSGATADQQAPGSRFKRDMLDVTLDCIKVLSPEGVLINMNRAGCQALGVPEDSGFGMEWLPLLPDSVRAAGDVALREAAQGRVSRFTGYSLMDGAPRHWDNLLTPLIDEDGQVQSILCVSRDVTAQIALDRQLAAAIQRERLLAQEMRHRIKNVFAIVSGLITMAEKEAAAAEAPGSAIPLLRDKLRALSRASDAIFASSEIAEDEMVSGDFGALIKAVMAPYEGRYAAEGGTQAIGQKNMTTVALFLHELATNSLKHGALSTAGGHVAIAWHASGDRLALSWTERGGPAIAAAPTSEGFGSAMLERLARSVGGTIARDWRPAGLVARLTFPFAGG
ncbi:PAS domain-containing protein [Bosea sp. TWI1241]|uniref:PAS domain-containing protein n=1 Tax=Bosea sp. TWI1241 TaxID=3148904 RepID=UPI00320B23AA